MYISHTLPDWVGFLQSQFETTYIDDHGMMMISMNSDGSADFAEPVIADFGDILPFLWQLGMHDFVTQQLELATGRLDNGLYVRDGRTRLFLNHDWLLGLIDLYRQSGKPELLTMAEEGARNIAKRFFHHDLLIDEPVRLTDWRTWLAPASPFNGGYIELWLDLYRFTQNREYRAYAERLAAGWTDTNSFVKHGVFSRRICNRSSWLDTLLVSRSRMRARLFKDNTNLMWGILVLYQRTGEQRWRDAVTHWMDAFERHFWNQGDVFLMLDPELKGYNRSIKAAFSALDLLCDIHDADIERQQAEKLAKGIADKWTGYQWENGLFPEQPAGDADHLDANVDMVVGLAKLYAITGEGGYLETLTRCRQAIIEHHRTTYGFCQSVKPDGTPSDPRIKIKYQGLLLKLALLPEDPANIFEDEDLMELLRDR